MSKKILRYTGTFAAVLGLFWALLILTSLIPNGQIKRICKKVKNSIRVRRHFPLSRDRRCIRFPITMMERNTTELTATR